MDIPLIFFFLIAYLIGWGLIPVLSVIAQNSGLDNWQTLSQKAEALNFKAVELSAAGWVVYLITRVQDFSFSIAGIIMIAVVSGWDGLKGLGQRGFALPRLQSYRSPFGASVIIGVF